MKIYQPLQQLLEAEEIRQTETACFIASENFASDEVRALSGSVFTNKYTEGYPGKRYYHGCENYDDVENIAIDLCTNLFGYKYANVQPHSGSNANLAVMNAFLKPGDKIVAMDLSAGGHLSHGSKVNISGNLYEVFTYGLDLTNGFIDYTLARRLIAYHKPKLIIAGASAYTPQINWFKFREAANEIGPDTIVMADIAHYSGLIAGGEYMGPKDHADIITSTTHKTLRGPRGGIIMWNDDKFTKRINKSVFPGLQGGPLMNQIAAKAQCFWEASQPEFKTYAKAVVDNSRTMAKVLVDHDIKITARGVNCVDSHMLIIDLQTEIMTGQELANVLYENGICVNKNAVHNDPRPPTETSGIRIGTAAETTKNRPKEWFEEMARKIAYTIKQWA